MMILDTTRVECWSLLGRALYARQDGDNVVAPAEAALAAAPDDVAALFALGQAYHKVWRYHAAVDVYTRAAALEPTNPLVYRHRGHRYINLRQFDAAVADLDRAASLDADSFDIWYHLGLARYLRGDFAAAASAYENCMRCSHTDDKVVATADWWYMTLRRLGDTAGAERLLARITPDMQYGDNRAYFTRLMVYKGRRSPSDLMQRQAGADADLQLATEGYGLGNWRLYNGDSAGARAIFAEIVAGAHWPAFGFVAAEAELARGKA